MPSAFYELKHSSSVEISQASKIYLQAAGHLLTVSTAEQRQLGSIYLSSNATLLPSYGQRTVPPPVHINVVNTLLF